MNRGVLYAVAFSLMLSGCKLLQREISADMSAVLAEGKAENPWSEKIHPSFFVYGKTFINLDETGRIMIELKRCHREQLENFIASLNAHLIEENYTYEDDLLIDPLDEQDTITTGLTLSLQENNGLDIFSQEGAKLASIDKWGFIVFENDIRAGQIQIISGLLQYILEDCPVFDEDDSYQQKKYKVALNKPIFLDYKSPETSSQQKFEGTKRSSSTTTKPSQINSSQINTTPFKTKRFSISGKKIPRV